MWEKNAENVRKGIFKFICSLIHFVWFHLMATSDVLSQRVYADVCTNDTIHDMHTASCGRNVVCLEWRRSSRNVR